MSKDQEEHQSCCWLVQELREMEPSQNILALRGGAEEQPWAADTPPCSLQHLLRTALHSPPLSSTLQLTLTHASCTCLALVFYLPYLLLTPSLSLPSCVDPSSSLWHSAGLISISVWGPAGKHMLLFPSDSSVFERRRGERKGGERRDCLMFINHLSICLSVCLYVL